MNEKLCHRLIVFKKFLFMTVFIVVFFSREKMHLKALKNVLKEDLITSSRIYDDILFEHPHDQFALSMIYFLALYSGQKTMMRNVPARIIQEFTPSNRFYG